MYDEIMSAQQHVRVKPGEFKAFLLQGQDILIDVERACGVRSVSLDLKTRSVQFMGDDAVSHRVAKFIATLVADHGRAGVEKGKDEAVCPICYCEPDSDSL